MSRVKKLSVEVSAEHLEIRFFTEKDRGALQKIYLDSRKKAFHWMDNSLFKANDFDRDTEGECIWVASVNNLPVGFISVWIADNFVHNLFVHPSYFGNGIGSVLLNESLKKMGRPARLKCLEKNTSAKYFYLAKDWKVISCDEGPDGKYYLMQFDEELS